MGTAVAEKAPKVKKAKKTEVPALQLSDDEFQLLKQLCLPNKVVCQNLKINSGALRMRVARLLVKVGVENRRALIIKALRLRLVTVSSFMCREFRVGDGE